jgi:hypothetical protein
MNARRTMVAMSLLAALTGSAVRLVAQRPPGSALETMTATEKAFAAATAELGVRNGFLTFFADNAIAIEPVADGSVRIVSARERLASGPAPSWPLPNALTWGPYIGQASADGQIGWLSGPSENRTAATGTIGRGLYFSVWRRQADGIWKVWLDQGAVLPEPWNAPGDFRAADLPGPAATEDLATVDGEASASAAAWVARVAPSVRVHRSGTMPILGAGAAAVWRNGFTTLEYLPARTELSSAKDMAFVIGGYRAATPAETEHGLFIRVWQTNTRGAWTIVLEVNRPA